MQDDKTLDDKAPHIEGKRLDEKDIGRRVVHRKKTGVEDVGFISSFRTDDGSVRVRFPRPNLGRGGHTVENCETDALAWFPQESRR